MQVRRFVAPSIRDAMDQVRSEFGPEAVILHTRKYRRRGLFNRLRRPQYEVVAAVEPAQREAMQRVTDVRRRARAASAHVQRARSAPHSSATAAPLRPRVGVGAAAGAPDAVSRLVQRLNEQEIADEVMEEIVESICGQVERLDLLNDIGWVYDRARTLLEGMIPCIDPDEIDKAQILPLVGPTGVGKTTTIAKLAANFALLGGSDVAIITADTYRIAAVDQLRTYAAIINTPLSVVYTPDEMRAAIEEHAHRDMILIDTAGRSQHHEVQLKELQAFLDILPEAQTHLVLSATTKMRDLLDIVDKFRPTRFERVIITKMDETHVYGTLLNLARVVGKPFTYLTTGQDVPDDIEVAVAGPLVDSILPPPVRAESHPERRSV